MAYTVNRRTSEIGIRMALGADRVRVARMILRETLLLVVGGLAVGLPGAVFASHLIASQLFAIKPWDPITFLGACVLMAVVRLTASYIPARRAASIHHWRLSLGVGSGRDWHGDEKVAGEKIGIQVSQRGRTPQFGGRNPPIRFIPFPAGRGNAV